MAGSKKPSRYGSPQKRAEAQEEQKRRDRSRRRRRILIGSAIGLAIALLAAGVLYAADRSEANMRDLSVVGSGVPTVVQVHDSNCPFCNELRANVRRASRAFSNEDLLIRMADIYSESGRAFASRYTGERRVTLLFFDGAGELVEVQSGVQEVSDLRTVFAQHASGEL